MMATEHWPMAVPKNHMTKIVAAISTIGRRPMPIGSSYMVVSIPVFLLASLQAASARAIALPAD